MTRGSDVHEEDLRTDLEAMLKASRELGPEMDRALVESFLARQRTAIARRGRAPRHPRQPALALWPGLGTQLARAVVRGIAMVAVIVVAVTVLAWLLWMLLPCLMLLTVIALFGMAWMLAGRWGRGGWSACSVDWRRARRGWRVRPWQDVRHGPGGPLDYL